jgi:hypothetical protein
VRSVGPGTWLLLASLAGAPAAAELHVWVDAEGRTHVTDDPAAVPAPQRGSARDVEEIRGLWDDGLDGPAVETPPGASGRDEDRQARLLRDALDDLSHGETARAAAALAEVLRREPMRPEAHWYLALLDWQRGRLDASEAHLRAFLQSAGDRFEPWRAAATRRLARLEDERRLLAPPAGAAPRAHETPASGSRSTRRSSRPGPATSRGVGYSRRRAGRPRASDSAAENRRRLCGRAAYLRPTASASFRRSASSTAASTSRPRPTRRASCARSSCTSTPTRSSARPPAATGRSG